MGSPANNSGVENTVSTNANEATTAAATRRRILVIDDDPVVRKIIMELLSKTYTVITSSTGVQLPELLKKHRPDLVVLDVMMPWINGFELCRILKSQAVGDSLPVLFLTGCKEKEDILTGKEVGAAGYLTKPFYAKDLYREIQRLLPA